jgi:hypothetical protein
MVVVIYARPSGVTDPGHMVVGQEGTEVHHSYFGFRFDPADMPEEFRSPERWRDWLFDHTIPGLIEDETDRTVFALREGAYPLEKRAVCPTMILAHLPPQQEWRPHARYSFNPDDFHNENNPCYNCVTWATRIANQLVPGVLNPVRQGRVRLIVEQLKARAAPQEGAGA